ncbi:MAG: trehalose-6-phosphate synthase [Chloroflexi bacterium]|nr:trehalose-6-phosphate synthase [Chloroflexota bacterium]
MSDQDTASDRLARLQSLAGEMLAHRRLIVASNRGPLEYTVEPDGNLTAQRGGGGVVTALLSATRLVPATWVATAITDGDRIAAQRADHGLLKVPDQDMSVRFVTVPPQVYQRHYSVFCNPLLWFIQHFMWNSPRTPNIGRAVYEAWDDGYIPVNQAIADAIADEASQHDEPPFVLVHDYHLYLTPAMVRKAIPGATILHFTHIPWPGPRYWGMLPEFMRRRIHEDMCQSDIVGLQTNSDVQDFIHSCEAILNGCEVDYHEQWVRINGRTTQVKQYPISVDAAFLLDFARSDEVRAHKERLKGYTGYQTVVRIDRSEPSKNIIRGLRAWEVLLERSPELRGKVNLLQFLVPSRSDLGVYQTYTDEIFELAEAINDDFGDIGWQPVRIFYEENWPQAIAAMTLYDVLLVNPIIDGMNLVSKEGPLLNEKDGVMILSEQAGSFEQLGDHVLPVAPSDLEGTVRALQQALAMPPDERRKRSEALKAAIQKDDITRWLEAQLLDLKAAAEGTL